MKVLENKRTGISLVALIVTIIVLIILTGAVIVTFMEGGIVDRAKYAVRKSDLATLQESYMIEYNKKKIDVDTGTTEGIDKIEILEKAVKNVKLDKDFKFATYAGTKSVTYTGDNEEIAKWVSELILEVSEGYILANGYLTNLSEETTVAQIKAQLGDDIIIKKYNGDLLGDGDKVGTGATIEKDGEAIATVILFGDADGDGGVYATDKSSIIYTMVGEEMYKDRAMLAGDVNNDGYISGEDLDDFDMRNIGGDPINQKRVVYKQPILLLSDVVYELDEEDGEMYPTYIYKYAYKWYKTGNDFADVINENGVYVAEGKKAVVNLTIPSGTTYLQIENELKEEISDKIQIIDIDDKSVTPEAGETFYISIPEIIDENTRSKVTSLKFKIKAIN